MATEARFNLRQDLIKAGLSTLAADLLANLFAAQQKQFEVLAGVAFPGVDRPWGVKPYPASAASGVISAGMLVRTTPNSLVPATGEGGDANLWANAFVMGVVGTGQTAQIYTAQGAASALLMVNEPVAGEKVSLLRGGMGTCSSITGSYDLQPVAQCEVSQTDTGGLALCSGIAFQTPLNQSLGGRFVQMNFDNVQQTVPATGVINTTWTGSTTGYLVSFENTDGSMATGTLLATRDGLGVAYRAIGLSAAGGFSATVETGVAVSGESDGPVAFTASFFNNDAGGRHLQAGPDVTVVGSTIKMNWSSGSGFYGTITHAALTAARTWTFQDATGTIPLLEVAQTWTATQTIGAAAWINFTPSTTQVIDAAGDTILANAGTVNLSNVTGNITLTSTPTIADGADGQDLVIHNLLASTSRVVLQAESGLAGSNLYLGAATRTLLPGGMIHLRFLAAESRWVEIAFVTSTS